MYCSLSDKFWLAASRLTVYMPFGDTQSVNHDAASQNDNDLPFSARVQL